MLVVELEVNVVVDTEAIVGEPRAVAVVLGRVGDVVDDANLHVARIGGDVTQALIVRGPVLPGFENHVLREGFGRAEVRSLQIQDVGLRATACSARTAQDVLEVQLIVEKRRRVDDDGTAVVVDRGDRRQRDDRAREGTVDRALRRRRARRDEIRTRPKDRDAVAGTFEAHELGRQMIGVPPNDPEAAETGCGDDGLNELAVELVGGEFEIDAAAFVPDRKEPALRLRVLDERVVCDGLAGGLEPGALGGGALRTARERKRRGDEDQADPSKMTHPGGVGPDGP